jgi:hypothetical protein
MSYLSSAFHSKICNSNEILWQTHLLYSTFTIVCRGTQVEQSNLLTHVTKMDFIEARLICLVLHFFYIFFAFSVSSLA